MPIRLKPQDKERVRIQRDFLKEVLILREKHNIRLERKQRRLTVRLANPRIDGWSRVTAEKELQDVEYAMQLMRSRGEGLETGRGGDDYEVTRLRKLSYVRMMVIKRPKNGMAGHQEVTWLIGETPEFTDTVHSDPYYYADRRNGRANYGNVEYNGTYQHGPYLVCVDTACFGKTEPQWHLLPKNMPRVRNRHLHAYDRKVGEFDREGGHNPLDGVQTTCWGKFAGIAHAQCEVWDVPGLFDTLYLFASTLNLDSQLVSIRNCPGIKLIERIE